MPKGGIWEEGSDDLCWKGDLGEKVFVLGGGFLGGRFMLGKLIWKGKRICAGKTDWGGGCRFSRFDWVMMQISGGFFGAVGGLFERGNG